MASISARSADARRRTRTAAGALAALLLAPGLVVGCGSDTPDYCATLKSDAPTIRDFTTKNFPGNFRLFPQFAAATRELGKQAPGEVEKSWQVLTAAVDGVSGALKTAGLTAEQLEGILTSASLPAGVTKADLAELQVGIQALTSNAVAAAATNITRHAQAECGVRLTAG